MNTRWVRIPIVFALAWILHRHLTDPAYASIFSGVNLAFPRWDTRP